MNDTKHRRAVILKLVGVGLLVALTARSTIAQGTVRAMDNRANQSMQSASLVLDWYPNSDHGGIYTAIDRGLLQAQHITLKPYVPSDTTAQIKLVAAGRADFGITYEAEVMAARARGIPVQSIMCIVQHPLDTLMTLRSSGITRPRQLVGKSIGEAGAPSDQTMVRAMLQRDGASIKRVKLVNVGYNLLPALLAHKVDAVIGVYWTWEAIQAEMKGYPVNVMRVERWGVPNYCELVMVASDHTIQTRPAYVRAVIQALQHGYAYAETHPSYAWNALHRADKTLDKRLVLRSLELLKSAILGARSVGYQDPSQWHHYAAWLSRNHLVSRTIPVTKTFTDQFLATGVR